MEKQVRTPKMIRQRRFLLVLPLLTIPFMTMIFWALGGGKVQETQAQAKKQEGFNINLPDAKLADDKHMDKMSYYNQARLDSVKFKAFMKNDPNYRSSLLSDQNGILPGQPDGYSQLPSMQGLNTSLYGSGQSNDPNADKIYRKLAELDKELNKPVTSTYGNRGGDPYQSTKSRYDNNPVNTGDVDRLEQMMHIMNQPGEPDGELQQLSGMLEKILDVQHPGRVQEKLRQASNARKGQVWAVSSKNKDNIVSLLEPGQFTPGGTTNGFYSITDEETPDSIENAIQAVIHESSTIVNGSTVKLRLANEIIINGVHIPKDNFLYGIASLNGERLNIRINSIRNGNFLFPVELSAYDMDGLDGIYIPGAITRDVAKQSAHRSLQGFGLPSLEPSWQVQAAGAGIEAAKSILSKKVKQVKVTLQAGYQVLLRDEKQNQKGSY